MALPNQIDKSTPPGSQSPSLGDDRIRELKLAIQDILGIPDATNVSAACFSVVAAGLDEILLVNGGAASATGRIRRNSAILTWHDGSAARQLIGGDSNLTANGVVYGTGNARVVSLGAATNGQLVIGSTGAAPVLATLTQGAGATITNGAGTITIAAAESGTWGADLADGSTRVSGTVYQNTSGVKRRVFAAVEGTNNGTLSATVYFGSANPPTNRTNVDVLSTASGKHLVPVSFEVPNNWYYKITMNTGGLSHWYELNE